MLDNIRIDIGTVALIVACLAFYARLILSNRRRNERQKALQQTRDSSGRKKGSRRRQDAPESNAPFASFSNRKRDWLVAAIGFVFIALGGLLRQGYIDSTLWQPMWWVLASLGIVAFSWLFG